MKLSRNTIITGLAALVVLGGIAYYFLAPKGDQLSAVSAVPGPASVAEASFLALAQQLGPISFDTKIFTDPRFLMLQDIHTTIVPEASGRRNPFAPLGK